MSDPIAVQPAAVAVPTPTARTRRPPRRRSAFYAGMTVLTIAFVLTGFWPYYRHLLDGSARGPRIIHLHAAVFSGWVLLLSTQVLLVLAGRTRLHRAVGRFGIGYGVLLLVVGLTTGLVVPALHVRAGEWALDRAASFLLVPIGDMALFATLFAAAIAYRGRPAAHKRLMLLATVALLFAPVGRLADRWIDPERFGRLTVPLILVVWLSPLLLGVAHDLWTRRRIHPAYLAGGAVLLAGLPRLWWLEHESWLRIGRAVIGFLLPRL